jgi:hypothetical protein
MGPVPLPQASGQGKNPASLAKRPMWFAGAVRFCARGAKRGSATSTNNVTLFVVSRIMQLVRRCRDPDDSGDYVGGSLLAQRFRGDTEEPRLPPCDCRAMRRFPDVAIAVFEMCRWRVSHRHDQPRSTADRRRRKLQRDHLEDLFPDGS